MSFVALDSANTLNPVQRLLKLTLDLFYACSTFDSIELKGPTVLIVRINILLSGMRSFIHLLWFLWLHELVAIWPPRRPLHTRPPQARCRPGRWLYPSHLLAVTIWGNRITRDWQVKVLFELQRQRSYTCLLFGFRLGTERIQAWILPFPKK